MTNDRRRANDKHREVACGNEHQSLRFRLGPRVLVDVGVSRTRRVTLANHPRRPISAAIGRTDVQKALKPGRTPNAFKKARSRVDVRTPHFASRSKRRTGRCVHDVRHCVEGGVFEIALDRKVTK